MLQAGILATVMLGLLLQDAEAQFVVGRVQIDDQAALQAALDPVLQILDLARRAVGRDDDLLVLIDQRVEGVEEFFLR